MKFFGIPFFKKGMKFFAEAFFQKGWKSSKEASIPVQASAWPFVSVKQASCTAMYVPAVSGSS